jgi:hypothetical protein
MNSAGWYAILGAALGVVIALVIMKLPTPRVRKVEPRPPEPKHRCRLPWWRPFRKTGTRVQCLDCGDNLDEEARRNAH